MGFSVTFRFNTENQALASWLDRAERCADLIQAVRIPGEADLADIGCGDEKLRGALERRGLTVNYQGFDVRPQAESVIPFDADREDLPRPFHLVAALGLIEYLNALPAFLRRMRRSCSHLALSHVASDLSYYSPADLERLGWRNHLSRGEVEELLGDAEFRVVGTRLTADRKTQIWMCE